MLPGSMAGTSTGQFALPPIDPRSAPIASSSLLQPSMRMPLLTSIRTNPATMPDLAVKNADCYEYLCEAYQTRNFVPTDNPLVLPPKASITLSARLPG